MELKETISVENDFDGNNYLDNSSESGQFVSGLQCRAKIERTSGENVSPALPNFNSGIVQFAGFAEFYTQPDVRT